MLRFALTDAFVSDRGVDIYQEFIAYLEKDLNRELKLVTGFSYNTVVKMLKEQVIEFGFICSLPYLISNDQQRRTQLVAAPVMAASQYSNKPKHYAYLVVRKESQYTSLPSLKGRQFVFNDVMSNTGYSLPRAKLIELGETEGFFSAVKRSGSHEKSMQMVAMGEADVGAIDSVIFDFEKRQGSNYVDRLKIIETLGPAGISPLVASVKVDADVVDQLQRSLYRMHSDPVGKGIIEQLLISKFVDVSEENYKDVSALRELAQKHRFLEIK